METYVYNCFGKPFSVNLKPNRYQSNGNLALQLVDAEDGSPVATATVNTDDVLPEGFIAVKDYSENKGMLAFLTKNGIVGDILTCIRSGWVEIPVVPLTAKGKALFAGV